ncbi:MAG: VWA domain-containing protein [Vicingaceae bacterium]
MKKIIPFTITLLYLLYSFAMKAQDISQTHFDLGKVSRVNEDVVELNIANPSAEDIYLLRIEAEDPIDVKYTSKNIRSNSATLLRFKLNPKTIGRSQSKVNLFFSHLSEPVELSFSMNVKELPRNNLQDCPSFNSADMAQKSLAAFNRQKKAKIKRYYVSIGNQQEQISKSKSREQEELAEKTSPAENNITEEEEERLDYPSIAEMRKAQSNQSTTKREEQPKGALHNRKKEEKKERKSPEERRNAPSLGQILFGSQEEEHEEQEFEQEQEEQQQQQQQEEIPIKEAKIESEEIEETAIAPAPPQKQEENLLDDNYKANNVVFLIDASNSMNNDNKMALLQIAMAELLAPLRSIDYLSIITYAGNARVLLPPTSGIEKDSIEKSIFNIQAEGSTQAVKGLNTAIDVGLANFIEGGNNQIILATDGAFDIGERNTRLRERIEETAQKGLKITVVGIQNENYTNTSLKEIASLGQSEFIRIKNKNQSKRLLEFVKANALVSN